LKNLLISSGVRLKLLEKHVGITQEDIEECFANLQGRFLYDNREQHKSNPQTLWFIAENNKGRLIKVVFIPLPNGQLRIRTAFDPNADEIRIYQKLAL